MGYKNYPELILIFFSCIQFLIFIYFIYLRKKNIRYLNINNINELLFTFS